MTTKQDVLLNNYIESKVDTLLEDDAYYEALATPIKPAKVIKTQHRKEIVEFLQMKDLGATLDKAASLIRDHLAELLSPAEFEKVKNEFDLSIEHMITFAEKGEMLGDKPVLFQQLFGFSDGSLIHIYELADHFIKNKLYENALKILTFLTAMNPSIPSFWISQGICYQLLNQHENAIAIFDIVKMLNTPNPAPFIYTAESYVILNKMDKAKQEIESVQPLLNGAEKGPWQMSLDFVTQKLNG